MRIFFSIKKCDDKKRYFITQRPRTKPMFIDNFCVDFYSMAQAKNYLTTVFCHNKTIEILPRGCSVLFKGVKENDK